MLGVIPAIHCTHQHNITADRTQNKRSAKLRQPRCKQKQTVTRHRASTSTHRHFALGAMLS